ncbi:MAG: endo-1,4-beta-xylanase [Lachnospiraceae bacterium]|nr:endo-1,4-beta-xylanase [Lachnospiraceae bacterium]
MKKGLSYILCFGLVLSLLFSPDTAIAKKKVKLSKKKITLQVGKKYRLKVKGTKKKVKWKSSKKKVATVSKKGVVKAKKKGKTKITAKVGKKKLICKVTVKTKKATPTPIKTKKPGITATPSTAPSQSPGGTDNPASNKPGETDSPTPSASTSPSQNPPASTPPSQSPPASTPPSQTPGKTSSPSPSSTPFVEKNIKSSSFENGTDGFTPRGDATVKSVSGGYSGNCLYVSGRTASWHGAGYEAKDQIVPGAKYEITAYVKLASGSETVKCTYQPEDTVYTEITSLAADTTWKKMTATFIAPDTFSMFYIYFEIPNSTTASFYLDEITLTQLTAGTGTGEELVSIKDTYDPLFGKMGTCLNLSQLQNAKTLDYVKKHYTSFTLENEMKPDTVLRNWSKNLISTATAQSSRPNDYVIPASYTESTIPDLNYSSVDAALKIAKANGLKMRAHTLVWHSQTPEWFFKVGYADNGNYVSTEVMDARMEMYIRSVMHHVYTVDGGAYKDVVYVWDVANEYLNNNADANWSKVYGNRSGNLETNPPYLKKAFEIAYDMLKELSLTNSVKLFYNDFNTYLNSSKVISLINYINQGESAKICAGVGMQSHLDVDYPTPDLFVNTVSKFAQAGFEIQITELDVTINNDQGNYKDEGQTDEKQAEYVGTLMKKLVALQRTTPGTITSFTWWGLYDQVSWRGGAQSGGNSHPLLFDTGLYDAKPSYYSFMDAINS